MAFQGNQGLNSPVGQQHYPGMGSPFAVSPVVSGQPVGSPAVPVQTVVPGQSVASPVIPGQASPVIPGQPAATAMFQQSPLAHHSPIPASMPGYLPLGQSSPVLPQMTTPMPPVIQGPHVRLFPPGGGMFPQTAPASVPQGLPMSVPQAMPMTVPWGAGAITAPSYPGASMPFMPPPTHHVQSGMFGAAPPHPPPPQPPGSGSQPHQQMNTHPHTSANQMPGNVPNRHSSFPGAHEDDYSDHRHRNRRDERRNMDKGRGHHSDRSNDRGDHFNRREDDRVDHSHSHRQEHGGREWRDERKHHSKDRSRDRSRDSDTRNSSSDSSHQGHRRNRQSDHDSHRQHSRPPDDFDEFDARNYAQGSNASADSHDDRRRHRSSSNLPNTSERHSRTDSRHSNTSERHDRSDSRHSNTSDAHDSQRHDRSGSRRPDNHDDQHNQRSGRSNSRFSDAQDRKRHDRSSSHGRSNSRVRDGPDAHSRQTLGRTGAVLLEDRDEHRDNSPVLRDESRFTRNDRGRGADRGFHGNRRGQHGSRSSSRVPERDHSRDHSRDRSHTRERSESRHRTDADSKRRRTDDKDYDLDSSMDTAELDRDIGLGAEDLDLASTSESSSFKQWKTLESSAYRRQFLTMKEHSGYWDALNDLNEEDPEDSDEVPEDTPAWVRCSAADLYYTKDLKTGCTIGTKKTEKLENRFESELVQANEKARKKFPEPEDNKLKAHDFLHFHDSDSDSSDSDSDDDVKNEIMEEWAKELKRKQEHPQRLHEEIWHNEPGMLNDGPLCRCSLKHRQKGIRHSVYPGEQSLNYCDPNSNNKDKLYHYKISMAPTVNMLTKTPSIIHHDNHEYMFEGFSIFTHKKISENMPLCKVLRFSMVYTIYTMDESFPENFTVRSLDLFTRYLYTELLELLDLNWLGPGEENSCQRFHLMPRFARTLPDNGKEILSMNEVLLYLLRSKQPLLDPVKLPQLLKLNRQEWDNYVDKYRGMIVTCPGMKPTSLRLDQLDKSHCEENDGGAVSYPVIVHCGVRPAQLSYCGDPEYKKKWREYMKLRHLYTNRPRMTQEEKSKLDDATEEITQLRVKSSKKRDVTVEISSEGFYRTGIRTDLCQHALLLPVLFEHLRFHDCLHTFEEQIGYTFKDRYLLQLAFTHSSYKVNFGTNPDHVRNSLSNCGNRMVELGDHRNNFKHTKKKGLTTLIKIMSTFGYKHEVKSEIPHNERLEFLGDAVIEFLSSIHLFFMFPYHDEGEMTTYRGSLVQNKNLTELAKKIHLEDYMLFAHGPDLCEELTMKHAMANCFEALMGAMMLDSGMLGGGLEAADKVFSWCLFDEPVLLEVWNTIPEHPLQAEETDGDRHWIDDSPTLQNLVKFEDRIGMKFRHIRLLAKAFCQRCVGYNNLTYGSNQRLEFLGDTIIQLIASEYLYKHFPTHHEGHLTLLRSSLVNNKTQATVCEELGIPEFVINDSPFDTRHTSLRVKQKADLLEALLGAMYVDAGLEFPKVLVECCFFPRLEEFILNQDWNDPKSQLQQCCLVLRDPTDGDPEVPFYKIINVTGPSNTRRYTVAVYFRGERLATGVNYGIQSAEMEAAAKALIDHKDRFLLPFFNQSPWFGRHMKNSRILKEKSTKNLPQDWQKR